jgi:hypothetical protein
MRSFLLVRLAVLAAALAIGLVLHLALRAELAEIAVLAETDVVAARAELAAWLRIGGSALFALTAAVGVSIALTSRRALAEGRFPPAGVWSFGAARIATGAPARRMAQVGVALGALLVLCSAAAGALSWLIAAALCGDV